MRGDLRTEQFALAALIAPVAMAFVHAGRGHAGDVAFFHEWYLALRESASFYRDGPGVNYPIVGVLLVCAPARAVDLALGHALDLDTFRVVLKATLVAGEVALIAAGAGLAGALGEARPRLLALLLYALPATWAGGAWFGQIDVWGSALLLAALWGALRFRQRGTPGWLALAVLALHAAMLAKQLTWFAAPPIALAILLGLARHGTPLRWALVIASPLLWLVPDAMLVLPDGRVSHVAHVVVRGAVHGDLAVASGASLWALIARGGTSIDDVYVLGVRCFELGWGAWIAAQVAVGVALWRRGAVAGVLAPEGANGSAWSARTGVAGAGEPIDRALVIAAGLGQLAMALFLTGVHERYFAHAVPLLVIGAGLAVPRVAAVGAIASTLVGLFVLSTVEEAAFAAAPLAIFTGPVPVALSALAWGIVLGLELARREGAAESAAEARAPARARPRRLAPGGRAAIARPAATLAREWPSSSDRR